MYEFCLSLWVVVAAGYLLRRNCTPTPTTLQLLSRLTPPMAAPSLFSPSTGPFWPLHLQLVKNAWLTAYTYLIFLAAHVIQTVLGRFNWREAWQKGGLILMGALLLVIPALAALFTAEPFQSQSLQSINETLQFIAALVILVVLVGVVWTYGRRMGSSLALRTAFVTLLFVLTLLTIRFTWLFNFVNYDYVNEVLVYAHGGRMSSPPWPKSMNFAAPSAIK
jgi:hypothetical protein